MIEKIMNAIKTTLVIENKESMEICKDKIKKIIESYDINNNKGL